MSNARNLSNLLGTGTTIATASIADDAITSAKIADDAVVAAAIADDAVGNAAIDLTANYAFTGTITGAGNLLQTKKSSRVGNISISSASFTEISTSLRVTITPKSSSSLFLMWCYLGTEVDGNLGHGMARVQYSTNSGSSWTSYDTYNVTGSIGDDIGTGFGDYFDHSFTTSQTVIFRVQYRGSNAGGGNHTIADTGPGESPAAQFIIQEVTDG